MNPSLDRTLSVDQLIIGGLHRAQVRLDPAGKGVNVSRMLLVNGFETVAVLPVGGDDGHALERLLQESGLKTVAVPISGSVRSNVSIVETDGTVTKLNEPGPELSVGEIETLISAALGVVPEGGWLVLSGSLPPGVSPTAYAVIANAATAAGVKIALDSSGPALKQGVPGRPALIKPNWEELSELVEAPLHTLGEVVSACRGLVDLGVGQILVSLGQLGAVLVTKTDVLHGRVEVRDVRSNVGAGDALLAGYVAGRASTAGALANGLAWARSAVRSPGTAAAKVTEEDRSAVSILEFDSELDLAMAGDPK